MKSFEAYAYSKDETMLIVYNPNLGNKINRILKTYDCTFKEYEEPMFRMTNERFDILKAQVRALKSAQVA